MKNKLPKYDKYKPSGVEWLGDIPEHWEVSRLKNHIDLITGFPFKSEKYTTEGIKLARGINVKEGVFNWDETRCWASIESHLIKFLLEEGDVLIAMDGSKVGKNFCKVQKSDLPILLLQRVARLRVKQTLNANYLFNHIQNKNFLSWVEMSKTDPMVPHIAPSDIENFIILVPPLTEQTRIAEFLDRKTAQIDQAIGIKEKQIALLKERRQLMIHRAVTRGVSGQHWDSSDLGISGLASESNSPKSANQVNPDSDIYHRNQPKLKPSGVEWIGDIPEHWEVKKIKHITSKIGSGVTPSGGGTTYLDSGIPLLRSQNILFGKIELEGVAYISDKIHASMSNSQVKKGDVLLNVTGGSIGRCHFVELDIPMNVNQHVCIIRPTEKIISIFLNSLLTSNVGQSQIWFFQQGGGREGLNFQAIKNFLLPLRTETNSNPYRNPIFKNSHSNFLKRARDSEVKGV